MSHKNGKSTSNFSKNESVPEENNGQPRSVDINGPNTTTKKLDKF